MCQSTLPVAVTFLLIAVCTAHPDYLDCTELSKRIARNATIMSSYPRKVSLDDSPFALYRVPSEQAENKSLLEWKNFSIHVDEGYEMELEILPSPNGKHNNITCYGNGICGMDPRNPGRGLCQKCSTNLFAMDDDCTSNTMKCVFGVATYEPAGVEIGTTQNLTLLAAFSEGGSVGYIEVNLAML